MKVGAIEKERVERIQGCWRCGAGTVSWDRGSSRSLAVSKFPSPASLFHLPWRQDLSHLGPCQASRTFSMAPSEVGECDSWAEGTANQAYVNKYSLSGTRLGRI